MTTSVPIGKPKLLFVGAFPPPGNTVFGGNVTDCQALMDAGLASRVNLITLDSTQRSVPPPPIYLRAVDAIWRFGKFLWLTIGNRPKTILIFCSVGFSFIEKSLMACCSRLIGCRVLFSPRGGRLMDDARSRPLYAKYVKAMMCFTHKILCQGDVWSNFFVDEIGISASKCVVMKSWTATTDLLNIGADRQYCNDAGLHILFLGRLDATKGILELIDAFAAVHTRFPSLKLDFAGEGKAFRAARAKAKKLGLSGSITFLGWIEGDQKLAVFSRADIFCLPSHYEGLPNAMIEAMAAGLPVVVTPVGAIPDVILNGQNGLLTPVGDIAALTRRLESLICMPQERARLGRAAYHTAFHEFTARRAVDQLVSLCA